jgi:hypothetical protein
MAILFLMLIVRIVARGPDDPEPPTTSTKTAGDLAPEGSG